VSGTEAVECVIEGQSLLATGLRQARRKEVSRGRLRDQGMGPAGIWVESNRPEPTGYDYAVANFIPLPHPLFNPLSEAATSALRE
jgi:hypothetical protein